MTDELPSALSATRTSPGSFIQSPAAWLMGLTVAWVQLWWWTSARARPAHFFLEGGTMDAWSTTCFLTGAALAWAAAVVGHGRDGRGGWFWRASALGLLVLALDDRFQIHERLHTDLLLPHWGPPPLGLRNWNDLVLILYALVGIAVCVAARHVVLRNRRMRNCLLLALLLFAIHSGIDTLVASGPKKTMWEEPFKALAAASIAAAFLYGLVDRIALSRSTASQPSMVSPWRLLGPTLLVLCLAAASALGPTHWVDALRYGWGPPSAWFAMTALGCGALLLGAGLLVRGRPSGERAAAGLLALSLAVLAYGEMTYACGSRFVRAALEAWIHSARGPDAAWLHSDVHIGTILTLAAVALGAQLTARRAPVRVAACLLHVTTVLAMLIVLERLARPADLPRWVRGGLHVGLGLSGALAALVLLVSQLHVTSGTRIKTDDQA